MKRPLLTLTEKFGDKAKLVTALEQFTKDENLWVNRVSESKGLAHVSNAKLLKLHATFTAVKDKFGSREKLIDGIREIEKRLKDEGYKTHLSRYPVPRLWDMYKSAEKRSKAAAKSVATHEAAPAKSAKAKK